MLKNIRRSQRSCYSDGNYIQLGASDSMRYVTDDDGRLNNFALEPKMYQAEPMTAGQKRNIAILSTGGLVLVIGLVSVAFFVS